MNFETQYLNLLQHLLDSGNVKEDRTGTGTKSVFGYQIRHDLSQGFPLMTTKKVHFKSVAHELIWFLRGDTNTKYLKENGVSIWQEWEDNKGELGRVYGAQWRSWRVARFLENPEKEDTGNIRTAHGRKDVYDCAGNITFWYEHDQISEVIEEIKSNPNSRRLLVSAWNVSDLPHMALPPCHYSFQFYVHEGKLSCMFQMRKQQCAIM